MSLAQESETDSEDIDFEEDPHTHTKGEFFGCYLLVSTNPRYKGRTYIGFTVDPNRRIKQHNAGHHMGGAKRTSGRGPWEMILIVHGFPNDIAALRVSKAPKTSIPLLKSHSSPTRKDLVTTGNWLLSSVVRVWSTKSSDLIGQFEWAWQHPAKSRRLGKVVAKKTKETALQHRFRILAEMLSIGPWWRLPLTIRWLKQDYEMSFPLDRQPPIHMPITYGLVGFNKPAATGAVKGTNMEEEEEGEEKGATEDEEDELGRSWKEQCGAIASCCLCSEELKAEVAVHCYHDRCSMSAHMTCLGPKLCESGHIVPISGPCPSCGRELLWGELVKRRKAAEKRKEKGLGSQSAPKRQKALQAIKSTQS